MPKDYYQQKSRAKALIIIIAVCSILIAAVAFQLTRPYPEIEIIPTASSVTLPGEFTVTFPEEGQSAVGTDSFGIIASTPDQNPIPIASVAKIMTALLVLENYPLEPGASGPSLTMTAEDFQEYQAAVAAGHSVLRIAEGVSLTQRQMLEGLMLPSGNNIANKLGRWVAGSDENFVHMMNERAQSLGMNSTHYADASGFSPQTVSTAIDQVKLAQAAMQDPVFREIVAMPQATIPVAGTVYNVNNMLGRNGVVGIRTGSTTRAGGNFVSASPVTVGNETHYLIAAVFGQYSYRSLQTAIDENVNILNQVRPYLQMYPVAETNVSPGKITTAWDSESDLFPVQALQVFGYPGMVVPYSLKPTDTPLPLSAGRQVVILEVYVGNESKTIPLYNATEITKPDLLWRLLRF